MDQGQLDDLPGTPQAQSPRQEIGPQAPPLQRGQKDQEGLAFDPHVHQGLPRVHGAPPPVRHLLEPVPGPFQGFRRGKGFPGKDLPKDPGRRPGELLPGEDPVKPHIFRQLGPQPLPDLPGRNGPGQGNGQDFALRGKAQGKSGPHGEPGPGIELPFPAEGKSAPAKGPLPKAHQVQVGQEPKIPPLAVFQGYPPGLQGGPDLSGARPRAGPKLPKTSSS